mmetsp:Transcript_17403/g.19828  ORF Transcript_17403/g.19828 Transcript_17403/m.19828 type:complete len:127 (-) Transcript_17403:12-392(-)
MSAAAGPSPSRSIEAVPHGKSGPDDIAVQRRTVIQQMYSVHESQLTKLRDELLSMDRQRGASYAADQRGAAERAARELFDAKFQLAGLRKSVEDAQRVEQEERQKNAENMRLLHSELRKTHEAMRY